MDRVSILPNQRVGISDYEDGAGGRLVQEDQWREGKIFLLPSGRSTGQAVTSARIFGGFAWDAISLGVDTSATLNRGTGLFPILDDDGTLAFGQFFGYEGAASLIVDFSGSPSTTQAVYVRAVSTLATFQNRVFWKPSGAPAVEFVDNVSTRRVVAWEVTTQLAAAPSPGTDWVKVWEVVLDGGSAIASTVDYRHFYFEGDAQAPSTPFAQEWGDGANDRSADRETHGITDDHLWKQLVRRQLADIVGDKHYTVAPASLTDLAPLKDRFVTVDKPGGAGGDGDHATLNAAITALNAADGGTVLLQEGTYTFTAALPDITTRINIIGVEAGVILENNFVADDFLMTFASGSEGSLLRQLSFTEHAVHSEKQLEILADDIRVEQCSILGMISIDNALDVVINQCAITGPTSSANATLTFTAANTSRVRISASSITAGVTTLVDTFLMSGASDVSIDNCVIVGTELAGAAPRLIRHQATTGRISIRNCTITTAPFAGGFTAISILGGTDNVIDNCLIKVKASVADNLADCVLEYSDATVTRSLVISNTTFDFGDYLCDASALDRSPIHIAAGDCKFNHCKFTGITLSNDATSPTVTEFIELDPVADGTIIMDHCTFVDVTSEGSGNIDMSLIGQNNSLTGSGHIALTNLFIDGSDKTFRTAGDNAGMINFDGGTAGRTTLISGCHLFGGTWDTVLFVRAGCIIRDNTFLFEGATPDIDEIVETAGTAAEGSSGYCIFQGNFILHDTIVNASTVRLNLYHRVGAFNNTIMNTGAAPTQSMEIANSDNGMFHGNNVDDGLTYTTVTIEQPVTASLSTLNILA